MNKLEDRRKLWMIKDMLNNYFYKNKKMKERLGNYKRKKIEKLQKQNQINLCKKNIKINMIY